MPEKNSSYIVSSANESVKPKPGSVATIVLTFNEEQRVRECLESLTWSDEVWVVDSLSTDRTCEICSEFTSNVVQNKFENFGLQRNWALDNLPFGTEWIMFVDADERVTAELRNEIMDRVGKEEYAAYFVPRKQVFWGKQAKYGDWWPGYRIILLRKDSGRFLDKEVHEEIEIKGPVGIINHPIISIYWQSAEKMLYVLNYCTTAEAIRMYRTGQELYSDTWPSWSPLRRRIKALFVKLPFKPICMFFWKYFVRQGFRDGRIGFVLALEEAMYVFFSYLKLWELKQGFTKPPTDLIWRKK